MIDLRKKLISQIGLSIAISDMGMYPQSITGGDKPYEKRTEWMEGWNAYSSALVEKWCQIGRWLRELPDDIKTTIEDLLIEDDLELSVREEGIKLYVNCNDLFYWACADAEEISFEEIPDFVRTLAEIPHGTDLWVCRKRKMRPQKPCYKSYSKEEAELFNAAGPERVD